MRRTVILCGAASFVMAFLGTVLASTVAVPAVVGAQEARIRAEQFTVVGDNGADGVRLGTGPGLNSDVRVLDTNGVLRAAFNTGGILAGNDPDGAGFNVYAPDGTTVLRLGMGHGPRGDQPLANVLTLWDWQGQPRIVLRLDENGTPSIRMLDAGGNVTWEAK